MLEADSIRKRLLAHRLRESGLEVTEIADAMGLSERHISRYLSLVKPNLVEVPRNQTWRDRAACAGADTELFYPNAVGVAGANQKKLAMGICAECPVTRQCREVALANFECHGVWAGEDFSKYRYSIDEDTGEVMISIQERSREPYKTVS